MVAQLSTSTKMMFGLTVVMCVLLIGNYVFARQLYAYSFDPAYNAGTFNVRGSDAAEWFAFPEDRVGSVLSVLFVGCLVAFVLQFRNDRALRKSLARVLRNSS